jgi:hypothetical protein
LAKISTIDQRVLPLSGISFGFISSLFEKVEELVLFLLDQSNTSNEFVRRSTVWRRGIN